MVYDGFGQRDRFLRALEAVDAASDLVGLKAAIDGLIEPYGLKHAVLVALTRAEAEGVVLFTYPTEWIEHYMRRRYAEIDPVLRMGATSVAPFDWSTLDRSAPRVSRFFGEAEDAGVGRQGLTLPSRGPSGTQVLFSVTAEASASEWRGFRHELMRDMGVIGSHLHAKFLTLQGGGDSAQPARPRLSARERETLQWAAAGWTIDQTAGVLGLSSSAVRTYLDAARGKLNCLTKPQAVAVAMKLGLIDV